MSARELAHYERVEKEWRAEGWDTDHPSVRHAIRQQMQRECAHTLSCTLAYGSVYVERCEDCGAYGNSEETPEKAGESFDRRWRSIPPGAGLASKVRRS